ncbi:MAG: tape measure protein, partial [Prevotella sp.]
MSSIDNRVVKMEMDNGQFENNARTSINTLDKLKSALKLNKATDGLDKVDKKMKEGLSTQDLSSKVGALADRFSVMGTVAMGVMSNIATRAVYAGSQVLKSFTLGPIIQGFQEYETQMNSIQTIMANTSSKGTTLKQVTAALDELNTYADKTIYNFTEMTRNIGTFTAAGVDLKLATSSIKGIANLAAVSGSNSQQASTAMYQLSQAIATGSVRLMDWNSVVNAGMGGEVFQKALIRTSNNLKTGADAAIKVKGSFRDSLREGWLTSEVLTETLKQFQLSVDTAEDYNNAIKSLVAQGYTQEEAKQIADMAKTAGDAATKVKTFTQLIDTLKEAIGSGWSKTFQILLGDFEEARNSWTSISETLGDLVSASSDARNEILQGWADLGGRKELFGTLADSIKMVVSWMDPLKKGFQDVFPPVTAKRLFELTQGFHDFIKGLTLSDKNSKKLRKTISNLVSPFKLVTKVLGTLTSGFSKGIGGISGFTDLLIFTLEGLSNIVKVVTDVFDAFFTSMQSGVEKVAGSVSIFQSIKNIFETLGSVGSAVGSTIAKALESAAKLIGSGFETIIENLDGPMSAFRKWLSDNFTFENVIKAIRTGLFSSLVLSVTSTLGELKSSIGQVSDIIGGIFGGISKNATSFKDSASKINDALKLLSANIRATTILEIAGAVALLAYAMTKISDLDLEQIVKSIAAMSALFLMLQLAMKALL